MGAGSIAAGDEGVLAVGNGCEGGKNISSGCCAGRVSGGAAEYKVVVDEGEALALKAFQYATEAFLNKGLFLALGVYEDKVGIAVLGGGDGLAGTDGLYFYGVAIGGFKCGQQIAQQAGVIYRGSGRKTNNLGLLGGSCDLALIAGSVFFYIEQIVAILLNAVFAGQLKAFLAEEELNEGVGAGGVNGYIFNGVAVCIRKGSFGIYSYCGIGVDHLVILLFEDDSIHNNFFSGLFNNFLNHFFNHFFCNFLNGSLNGFLLGSAASHKAKQHKGGHKDCQQFLHSWCLPVFCFSNLSATAHRAYCLQNKVIVVLSLWCPRPLRCRLPEPPQICLPWALHSLPLPYGWRSPHGRPCLSG